MSMKQQQAAGGNRKPGGGGSGTPVSGGGGRQNMGRGRSSGKGPPHSITFDGIYANMRMVHILTSVVGSKCEVQVKNGGLYEGVFKTYSPKCDLVLDAAHKKILESSVGPKREDIVESILFKSSDFVVVHFKDMDVNYAKRDAFTDSAISSKVNGEHKEKDLEPWDGGDITNSLSNSNSTPTIGNADDLEGLDADVALHHHDSGVDAPVPSSTAPKSNTKKVVLTPAEPPVSFEMKSPIKEEFVSFREEELDWLSSFSPSGIVGALVVSAASNGWDPNDMFRYNEENYGIVSTYDSSLSSYTIAYQRTEEA